MSYRIINADIFEGLKQIEDHSIHCVITSPPYLGLRRYSGITPRQWADGTSSVLGEEDTVDRYVTHLVEVFRELKRVLHPRGTFWLNLGDCHAGGGRHPERKEIYSIPADGKPVRPKQKGMHGKNLLMAPARAALALQEDGWLLRSDIIWVKGCSFLPSFSGSVMPECLAEDTHVFVRNAGWVSQITLGQLKFFHPLPAILTPTGWKPIERVWETRKPAMHFQAGRVERIICSPDHRFPVSSDRRRRKTRLESAKDIRHEGYSDYLLYTTIERFLSPTIFHWGGMALDQTLGYLIGVYAAEGGVDSSDENGERNRVKLTIGSAEVDFEMRIRKTLTQLGISFDLTPDIRANAQYFTFVEQWARTMFETFVPGKCRNKRLNLELILNSPTAFRRGILDGYVEGDGHQRPNIPGWTVTSASEQLCDTFRTLASSLGIITSKYTNRQADPRTQKVYESYTAMTPYMTRRKSKSSQENVFQIPPRSRRLLPGPERVMVDIQVDGGVFLVGDGLITHNSTKDRPTHSHEHLFMFALNPNYFYDIDGCREPYAASTTKEASGKAYTGQGRKKYAEAQAQNPSDVKRRVLEAVASGTGRNLRDVWIIPKENYPGFHYATFSTRLVRPVVQLATSEKGCCPHCGEPVRRKTIREPVPADVQAAFNAARVTSAETSGRTDGHTRRKPNYRRRVLRTEWEVGCECPGFTLEAAVPCRVCDPFVGSGRAGIVTVGLGRDFTGIDASESYCRMASNAIERAYGGASTCARTAAQCASTDHNSARAVQCSGTGIL